MHQNRGRPVADRVVVQANACVICVWHLCAHCMAAAWSALAN